MSHTPWMRVLKNELGRYLRSESELNRRDFVKITTRAMGVGLLATQSYPVRAAFSRRITPPLREVTIIGGGLAGLTTAYRLAQSGIKVKLYEAQDRLGGRVFTIPHINSSDQFIELGAELIDSDHKEILALAHELGLATDDFSLEDSNTIRLTLYFEGKLYSDRDFQAQGKPLFERLAIDNLRTESDDAYLKTLDHTRLDEYIDSIKGLPTWIACFLKVAYEGEYGVPTHLQSALGLVSLLGPSTETGSPFGASDESIRIQGGNSALITALETQCKSLGVEIHLRHRLDHIHYDSHRKEFQLKLGHTSVSASHVVVTLPISILKKISGLTDLPLNTRTRRSILELGMGQNSKSMMEFSTRIWREEQNLSGSLFSDRGIECAWETSRAQSGTSGILTHFLTGELPPESRGIPLLLRSLDPVIPGLSTHYTRRLGAFSWPTHSESLGSYSCPLLGQWSDLVGAFQSPECEDQLYFAGEHCSVDHMGFMNGAVESAGRVARLLTQTYLNQSLTASTVSAL